MTQTNIDLALTLIPIELWNTLYMVFASTFFAVLIGAPLGIILTISGKGHLKENRSLFEVLNVIVNVGRSFPFAILMVAVIPFTRLIVGTSLGTTASIIPLTIAAIPFVARLVEVALKEVEKPMIEAAVVMGSSPWQIITKVMIPESLPTLVFGLTTLLITLIGYSTMAGTMGGGGLGKIAIQYGYQRFNVFLIVLTIVLLIIIVQLIQWTGNSLANRLNHKRGKVFTK